MCFKKQDTSNYTGLSPERASLDWQWRKLLKRSNKTSVLTIGTICAKFIKKNQTTFWIKGGFVDHQVADGWVKKQCQILGATRQTMRFTANQRWNRSGRINGQRKHRRRTKNLKLTVHRKYLRSILCRRNSQSRGLSRWLMRKTCRRRKRMSRRNNTGRNI